MAAKADLSLEEWKLLADAPVAVIAAIIGVSPGGPIQISQEVGAAVKSFEEAARELAGNPIIAGVLVELKGGFEAYLGGRRGQEVGGVDIFGLAQEPGRAVELCRLAAELLNAKAPAEGEQYRRWLYGVARNVAHAGVEGGLFGMGGQRVNEKEAALLGDLARALGVEG